jgi:hypothetical protein
MSLPMRRHSPPSHVVTYLEQRKQSKVYLRRPLPFISIPIISHYRHRARRLFQPITEYAPMPSHRPIRKGIEKTRSEKNVLKSK